MVSEIFPVAALEQYAERKFRHPAPCTSVHSPSMINTRQLPVSSTIVKYTLHSWEIYSKKDIKLFTQPSVKSPDKLLGLSRLRARDEAIVNCLQAKSTETCVKTTFNDVIRIP